MGVTPASPKSIFVEATNRCNLRCAMCPTATSEMKRPQGLLAEETLRTAVRDLPEGTIVGLSNWGEPLLHPRIVQLVGLLADRGYLPELVTNATLLERDLARSLIEAGLQRLFISVDGIGETYERIRGYPFGELLRRIDDLLAARQQLEVRLRVTLQRANNETFREVAELFGDRVDGISVQRQLTWQPDNQPRSPCPYLDAYLYFFWDGTAVPCCVDHSGELSLGQNQSAMSVWHSTPLRRLRQRHQARNYPPLCLACTEWPDGDPSIGFRFRTHTPW